VETTWDGLPVARENPVAACVVVWRCGNDRREYLVLHRHHHGPDYEGDWAWTPPSGARQPGEEPAAAALRELREETGLSLPIERVEPISDEVALFVAEAPFGAELLLEPEHDRFDWLSIEDACARCLPVSVADGLRKVASVLAAGSP
jgi:8-oxo-dGTP pyrophosphatase MutT (NUDIX family)